jgi:CHAT domain-containing protein
MLNNASPMYSHLALAEGGANEDGLLEAWELMQLDLKAGLAVLSACETARGRIGAGEGMVGLSWAMFIAGVLSIVVSQWGECTRSWTRSSNLVFRFYRAAEMHLTSQKMKKEIVRGDFVNPHSGSAG